MNAGAEERINRHTLYLRDEAGNIYARIHAHTDKAPATRVRMRKGGAERIVLAVEPMTNMIRVTEADRADDTPEEAMASRTRWVSVDDVDVVGAIPSREAAQAELARLDIRRKELEAAVEPEPVVFEPKKGHKP